MEHLSLSFEVLINQGMQRKRDGLTLPLHHFSTPVVFYDPSQEAIDCNES